MADVKGKRPSGTWMAAAAAVVALGLSGCNASGDDQATTPENAAVAPAASATQDANAAGAAHEGRDHDADPPAMDAAGGQMNHQMMEEHHRLRMDHMRMEEEHNAQKGAAHPGGSPTSQAPAATPPQPSPMQGMKHE